jgi:hypothetical protein
VEQINSFNLTSEEKFYYENSLNCIYDFSVCRKNFQDYFEQIENSGATIQFEKLLSLQETFTNYENFKLDDISYK